MDADGGFLAARNGIHYGFWSVKGISSGKNPVDGGLQGYRIRLKAAGPGNGYSLVLDAFKIGALADGYDDSIAMEGLADIFVELRIETAVFIKDACCSS